MNQKSYFLLLAALAPLAFFPLAAPFSSSIDSNESTVRAVPEKMGDWLGHDLPIEERTYEILETRNVLSRQYRNSQGDWVNLLMVSSNKDRRVAHPPEVCFLSSNYEILDEKEEFWAGEDGLSIPVREFGARHERTPQDQLKVAYLYKIGDKFTSNYYAQQIQFAFDNLTRNESKIFLIRVSSVDETSIREFLPQILRILSRHPN